MIFPTEEQKITAAPQYLLYMWYLEDFVRSVNFNTESIEQYLGTIETLSVEAYNEQHQKYLQLMSDMREDKVEGGGHLEELLDLQDKLEFAHTKLVNAYQDEEYLAIFGAASLYMDELKEKMENKDRSEIEIALIGIYGTLMLKMGKQPINPQTDEAIETFKEWMKILAKKYRQVVKGELTLKNSLSN